MNKVLQKRIETYAFKKAKRCRHMLKDDLIQEGWLGVLQAEKLFDATKGTSFETYATMRAIRAIDRAIAQQDYTVHVPVYLLEEKGGVRHALSSVAFSEDYHSEISTDQYTTSDLDKSLATLTTEAKAFVHKLLEDTPSVRNTQLYFELTRNKTDKILTEVKSKIELALGKQKG